NTTTATRNPSPGPLRPTPSSKNSPDYVRDFLGRNTSRSCWDCFSSPRRLPFAGDCGVEDGIDDGHVRDGVFDRDGNLRVFEDGPGEGVALQCVLVAGREGFGGDSAAGKIARGVDENASGTIWRRVDRDFDLDAAPRAEEVDALVWNQLRAAGEDGV